MGRKLREWRQTCQSGSPPGLGTNKPCRHASPFEDSLPDVASRSFRRRGEVGRTTTSTRTIFFWGVNRPKNSTAPTPLLEVGAGCSQLHRQNHRARSLIHARRRFRRWVYFGFSGELFFGPVGKLLGRSRPLRARTKAVFELWREKEESIFGR